MDISHNQDSDLTSLSLPEKALAIRKCFTSLKDQEALYQQIIKWGKKLPTFQPAWKIAENIVPGCQSLLYLHCEKKCTQQLADITHAAHDKKPCVDYKNTNSSFDDDITKLNTHIHKLYFFATSEALISSGLAALLIYVYSGETPQNILAFSPKFLEEIGLFYVLTPGRANGLASLYLRITEEAKKALIDYCSPPRTLDKKVTNS